MDVLLAIIGTWFILFNIGLAVAIIKNYKNYKNNE